MKTSHTLSIAAISLMCAAQLCAVSTATLVLKDGSTLKAEFKEKGVVGSTVFANELSLDAELLRSIGFVGTNGEAKVELVNGDKLTVNVSNQSFALASMLGDLSVPRANIRSMKFSSSPSASSGEGLVFHCTFDDESSISSPLVGPGGTVCSRDFTDGKVGRALRVPVGGSAGFFTLPPETFGKEGCIEFWAKLESRRESYRDCDPRFIFIRSPGGWFTVEYSSNNGAGRGGFVVRCFGYEYIKGGPMGGYRYADVIPGVTEWHHYAFSWTEDEMTIFIDGTALNGAYKTGAGRIDEQKLKSGPSSMGLPNNNASPYNTEPNAPFVIDELKIWGYAKKEFSL